MAALPRDYIDPKGDNEPDNLEFIHLVAPDNEKTIIQFISIPILFKVRFMNTSMLHVASFVWDTTKDSFLIDVFLC